jgi:hypothetical protein
MHCKQVVVETGATWRGWRSPRHASRWPSAPIESQLVRLVVPKPRRPPFGASRSQNSAGTDRSTYEIDIQKISAAETAIPALCLLSPFHNRKAKPSSPRQPTEAPAASRLAATRPRFVPSELICALRFFSWSRSGSTCWEYCRAGKKKTSGPRPKMLCSQPAKTVHRPPNMNLTAYSVFMRLCLLQS